MTVRKPGVWGAAAARIAWTATAALAAWRAHVRVDSWLHQPSMLCTTKSLLYGLRYLRGAQTGGWTAWGEMRLAQHRDS